MEAVLGFCVDGRGFGAGAGMVEAGFWGGFFVVPVQAKFGGGGFVEVGFGDGGAFVGEVAVLVEVDSGVDGDEGVREPEDAARRLLGDLRPALCDWVLDSQDHYCQYGCPVTDAAFALGTVRKIRTTLRAIDPAVGPHLHCTECREPEDCESHIQCGISGDIPESLSSLPQWDDGKVYEGRNGYPSLGLMVSSSSSGQVS